MTRTNGHCPEPSPIVVDQATPPQASAPEVKPNQSGGADLATRTKLRAGQQIRQNRTVILAAGAVVFALLVFAFVSVPRSKSSGRTALKTTANPRTEPSTSGDKSLLPITDSGRPAAKESHDGFFSEQDVARTAKRPPTDKSYTTPAQPQNPTGTLASIPPFGEQSWQAPPYQPGMGAETKDPLRDEHDRFDKSSLIFVRSNATSQPVGNRVQNTENEATDYLGLPTGTRLRARLESSASTAVRTPVLAVIEYNYERNGEIVVPAGAKAIGQIQEADRSGYMRIQFDSLMLPDGASIPIQAAATDLQMRPVRGKVEGKNTSKNILVRSLSGIGQAGAMLVGRGSLNQPLSESDLIRERVSNNIGQASDEEISRLAITARVVVSVSAGTPIYVVLEQSSKPVRVPSSTGQAANSAGVDQLQQLLRLQQELNTNTPKEQ